MRQQFAGVASVSAAGGSDLVLPYNIAFNSLTGSASLGAVGLDWQLGGLGATGGSSGGPFNSQPAAMDGSTSQLVQAMAGFGGGGATDTSQAALVGADASQQTFLAAPHARGRHFRTQRAWGRRFFCPTLLLFRALLPAHRRSSS
jgi:hypothetical protein